MIEVRAVSSNADERSGDPRRAGRPRITCSDACMVAREDRIAAANRQRYREIRAGVLAGDAYPACGAEREHWRRRPPQDTNARPAGNDAGNTRGLNRW